MKKLVRSLLVAGSVACLAAPAMAQTVLRYADYGANRGARAETVTQFLAAIEEKSEGRIKIEQHWAQSLLTAPKMLEGVRNGVASIVTVSASYMPPEQLYGWRVGDLPVRNPDEVAGAMALYEVSTTNQQIKDEFDRLGVVLLLNYSVGPIQMVCKGEPIRTVADFEGRKVRAATDYGQIYSKFGAIPVSLPLPKAYQALDSGLIDCSQAYGYVVESYKLHEVSDSYTMLNGGTIQANGIFMNKRDFDALDPRDQEMIIALGREYTQLGATAIRERNVTAAKLFAEGVDGKKLTVVTLPTDELEKLEAESAPFIEAYIEDGKKLGMDGAEIVEAYKALIAENLEKYAD